MHPGARARYGSTLTANASAAILTPGLRWYWIGAVANESDTWMDGIAQG